MKAVTLMDIAYGICRVCGYNCELDNEGRLKPHKQRIIRMIPGTNVAGTFLLDNRCGGGGLPPDGVDLIPADQPDPHQLRRAVFELLASIARDRVYANESGTVMLRGAGKAPNRPVAKADVAAVLEEQWAYEVSGVFRLTKRGHDAMARHVGVYAR